MHRRRRRKRSTGSYEQAAASNAKKHPPIPVAYSKRYKQDDIGFEYIGLEINNSEHNVMLLFV
jgi:hypothetical protein